MSGDHLTRGKVLMLPGSARVQFSSNVTTYRRKFEYLTTI